MSSEKLCLRRGEERARVRARTRRGHEGSGGAVQDATNQNPKGHYSQAVDLGRRAVPEIQIRMDQEVQKAEDKGLRDLALAQE